MLRPSCASEPRISCQSQIARPSATLPAAGTVVTLMKTPTMALDLSMAMASTPAAPARRATMNDHLSGRQMKFVCGRSRVTMSASKSPTWRPTHASAVMTAMAAQKVQTRSANERPARCHSRIARPTQVAATAANSGPTTIAPTTSTDESVRTAIEARAVAMTRNAR